MQSNEFIVRQMTQGDMKAAVDWAAREGWNPGLHDAELFYEWDRGGFLAAVDAQGRALGFISAVKYGSGYGFIGFFIVEPDLRGQRIGVELGRAALARLEGRTVGIDGVLNKVRNYQAFGFKLAHKNSRYMGINPAPSQVGTLVDAGSIPAQVLAAYDAECFSVERAAFVKAWISQPDGAAVALLDGGRLAGYAAARKCREGYKVGPLFSDSAPGAQQLLDGVLARLPSGAKYFLDVPENNPLAVALAQGRGMTQVFSTARMYSKAPPVIPAEKIFGITSFELG